MVDFDDDVEEGRPLSRRGVRVWGRKQRKDCSKRFPWLSTGHGRSIVFWSGLEKMIFASGVRGSGQ